MRRGKRRREEKRREERERKEERRRKGRRKVERGGEGYLKGRREGGEGEQDEAFSLKFEMQSYKKCITE